MAEVHYYAEGTMRHGTSTRAVLDLLEALHPPWHAKAACRGRRDLDWFPDSNDLGALEAARRVCRGCVVRQQCEAAGRANNEEAGVWGGALRLHRRWVDLDEVPDHEWVEHGGCEACTWGEGRLKAGYCDTCYRAWVRAGRPDRASFVVARRDRRARERASRAVAGSG